MKRIWVLSIHFTFCLLLKDSLSQYSNSDISGMQQLQYNAYKNPLNLFQQYPTQVWNLQDNFNYEEYDDYDEENTCSCENCDDLNPSCLNMCPNCASTPSFLPNPGYVFLPFPYPYPLSTKPTTTTTSKPRKKSIKATITTSESTTTEATTQKSTTDTKDTFNPQTDITTTDKLEESKVPYVITESFQVKDKSPYMLTSLRRTKPNWIPKYGIVPISNKFAEKLMLQLRSMKVLHPRKDNLRDVDEITPIN